MGHSSKQFKQQVTYLSLCISLAISSTLAMQSVSAAPQVAEMNYHIPQGNLTSALNLVAQKANVTLLLDPKKTNLFQAPALNGKYTADEAFQHLLKDTPFSLQKNATGYLLKEAPTTSKLDTAQNKVIAQALPESQSTQALDVENPNSVHVQLEALSFSGEKERDEQGYDDVYDKNISTVYAGKEAIERFKGTTPSDLLKGMSNVYSGDARNSGALDPNIRGMQGQGRVPVTIDGTEQSMTVWRGYNGANSRSYIDPNLLSSIQVVKGSVLDRDVKTGIAGGVSVKTLEADDVVREGQRYGAEIKVEGATNTTKAQKMHSYHGQDYRDVAESKGWDKLGSYNGEDPLGQVTPKNSSDNKLTHLEDQALRIAVATKQDQFDLLAAYAYRDRGNYFAGKHNSDFFKQGDRSNIDYNTGLVPYMATVWQPGNEVTNTSNRMESWLLKGNWRPNDDHALQLTYRDTNTIYGEIMPSRIMWQTQDNVPQWPVSEVSTKAYSLKYRFNPENSRWLDFSANLFQTDTESQTYSAGGFVNWISKRDYVWEANVDRDGDGVRDRSPGDGFTILDTAFTDAKTTHKGVSLSNKFNFMDALSLTVGADLTREKLTTKDEYINDSQGTSAFRMLPRAGHRSENQYWFNFDWQATSWLNLTAGARSVSYSSFDDFLNGNKDSIAGLSETTRTIGQKLSYTENVDVYTQEMFDEMDQNGAFAYDWGGVNLALRNRAKRAIGKAYQFKGIHYWYADADGKFHAENNPFLNGTVDLSQKDLALNTNGQPDVSSSEVTETNSTVVKKKKDHKNWAPAVSAAITLNPNNRFYINYTEAYRMPSMFETTLGFSASQSGYDLKPEHAHNFELAYVYNMKDLFNLQKGHADIKLAYFHNKTEDVIERNNQLKFSNIDKQTVEGYEFSGRFDNGKYFTDLSLVYNSKNEVCDESSGLLASLDAMTMSGVAKTCINYGFPTGYLVNMALPEYQANLTLGTRLLDNKLELGARLNYFEGYDHPYIGTELVAWFNAPLQWDDTLTVDAYAHYQHSEHLGFDLIGTNLTNQYYLDPLTRSAVAAPGRAFKLALSYKF